MVHVEDVINLYNLFMNHGIQVWVTGGWGIDALLGKETRPHKDLDVIMLLDDVIRMRELLGNEGYHLKDVWEENRWVTDGQGKETPTAFVLHDTKGREIDAHAMRFDDQGNGIPAWMTDDAGFIFRKEDLAGKGVIAGLPVHCLSPHMQMVCHTGYVLPEAQVRDLELLQEKFDVELIDD